MSYQKDSNQRKHNRHAYVTDIDLIIGDQRRQDGKIVNISLGGAFIDTDPLPPFGARIKLSFNIPGVPQPCEIPCIVRWTKAGIGAGIQFEHLRAIEVWALNKLINSLGSAI